ncbi:MAG: hypothetical protein RL701_7736, partial [Pseudomonadota bacterium]
RLLRWNVYKKQLPRTPLHFERCYRVEALQPEHQAWLDTHCSGVQDLELCDEPSSPQPLPFPREPYWLVAHSGPAAEVSELIAFARALQALEGVALPLWVITQDAPQELPQSSRLLHEFPAHGYFEHAERIVTAAGWNSMRQARPYRDKHSVLPLPRRFDDQFERQRRALAVTKSASDA